MKKTLVASAVTLGLGVASNASALTVTVTQMNFNGTYSASGTINSNGTGSFSSLQPFFGQHWTADAIAFFSGTGAHTWSDTVSTPDAANNTTPIGTYNYTFSLAANQVAWGTLFDWNGNYDIPVLNIMACTGLSTGASCTGIGTPMQTPPFSGAAPNFTGTVANDSAAVPIPAAAWLMGSGLVGLAGVARRRKKS
jgi:hypothetical protein